MYGFHVKYWLKIKPKNRVDFSIVASEQHTLRFDSRKFGYFSRSCRELCIRSRIDAKSLSFVNITRSSAKRWALIGGEIFRKMLLMLTRKVDIDSVNRALWYSSLKPLERRSNVVKVNSEIGVMTEVLDIVSNIARKSRVDQASEDVIPPGLVIHFLDVEGNRQHFLPVCECRGFSIFSNN